MLEPFERDLDKAAIHLKTVGDPDPMIRARSVLAFVQCISPYCPDQVAAGVAQVMADAVADRDIWNRDGSILQEIIRITMAKIRVMERSKILTKQTEAALDRYLKEKKNG